MYSEFDNETDHHIIEILYNTKYWKALGHHGYSVTLGLKVLHSLSMKGMKHVICHNFGMQCKNFGMSELWYVGTLVCQNFGISDLQYVITSVCQNFGMSELQYVITLECHKFGMS